MITKLKLEIQKERLKHFPCYIFISTLFVGGRVQKSSQEFSLSAKCGIIQLIQTVVSFNGYMRGMAVSKSQAHLNSFFQV